ncbi:DUF58 domain-containing protein [Microbacterium keratanolyticum]|uniref:DUF58 domain-containing protein n=1 Tax=Microbacterium keratanolyticum TaxID=67574 RepID=UPI00362BE0D7
MSVHDARLTWHRTLSATLGAGVAAVIAGLGMMWGQPAVVIVVMPIALLSLRAFTRPVTDAALTLTVDTGPQKAEATDTGTHASRVESTIRVESDAELVQLSIAQSGRRPHQILVRGDGGVVRTRARLLHSGPDTMHAIVARAVTDGGQRVTSPCAEVSEPWNASPPTRRLGVLPISPHLRGMHGAHEGRRPGQGGDFRDIHPFAPGDELRRVDWRATARLARRPGDMFVRRSNTLSDASIVIIIDTADDLGRVVASWGKGLPERSGVTSLDFAREAARSVATAAIENGDRVALHELVMGGRSVRSGGGTRHLARLVSTISAIGVHGEDTSFRRTPPVPPGSVIYVMSTFFEGAAAQIALTWRASGHRVVAVDTLPQRDDARLTPEQRAGMRTVLAERDDVFHDLRHTGVDVVVWDVETNVLQAQFAQLGRM